MADIANTQRASRSHQHDSPPSLEEAQRAPGMLVIAGALLAFVVSVAAFSLGKVGVGIATTSAGMLILSAGLSWLSMERRRVRDAERGLRRPNRQVR